MEEVAAHMGKAAVFSVLDAKSSFWQIPLDHASSMFTTFNAAFSHYRFLQMPFGISLASEVFQRSMEQLFDRFPCAIIVDDIIVTGKYMEQQDANLKKVLKHAREINLKLNPHKCRFRPVNLTCDASLYSLGTACLQDGNTYASRMMVDTETRYAQKELLPVVFACVIFNDYIFVDFIHPSCLDTLVAHTAEDATLQILTSIINHGCPRKQHLLPPPVQPYFRVRNELAIENGVIKKGHKAVIPASLQQKYFNAIHRGHPGCEATDESSFWSEMIGEFLVPLKNDKDQIAQAQKDLINLRNKYPLPLISSAFELLKDAAVFTKLDLRNAYHLVRIRDGDEWKTAFNTPSGHYEYLVMPFGLTNAPAVFQGMVNDVLRDMLNRFVFVYLDDILIFSPDETSHVQHVHQVLERLLLNDLFVKAEKCEFHVNTVQFLGYVVSPAGIQMDPSKVSAVATWPTPSSRKRLQGFLGFANFYRKFIRNFSVTAAPLHALTSPHVPFSWSSQAETAFMRLKRSFSSAPILVHPDPSLQFVVEVDASGVGIGAVLSQKSPTDGRLHPCAFLSKKLSPAERNYDVGNRELLAVKTALEEWRHWLEGTKQPFLVWTDHKNLEYIKSAKRLNSRQA
ncbi:uncharacterized protein LOC116976461, partial [Amblyraja radiata]|uniref:uncharacterized protein LOC116976461 n=1 Tax=Amblyraja radiata TaxID=386614 RepID=UPI00140395A1